MARPTRLTPDECDAANRAARFLPQTDDDTRPCIEVAGAQVYVYVHPDTGALTISAHYDDVHPPLAQPDHTVPTVVNMPGGTVYDSRDE